MRASCAGAGAGASDASRQLGERSQACAKCAPVNDDEARGYVSFLGGVSLNPSFFWVGEEGAEKRGPARARRAHRSVRWEPGRAPKGKRARERWQTGRNLLCTRSPPTSGKRTGTPFSEAAGTGARALVGARSTAARPTLRSRRQRGCGFPCFTSVTAPVCNKRPGTLVSALSHTCGGVKRPFQNDRTRSLRRWPGGQVMRACLSPVLRL